MIKQWKRCGTFGAMMISIPEEAYLPQDISAPYGYFRKNKNGNGDQLVMIYARDYQAVGRTYAQVIFVAESHS